MFLKVTQYVNAKLYVNYRHYVTLCVLLLLFVIYAIDISVMWCGIINSGMYDTKMYKIVVHIFCIAISSPKGQAGELIAGIY